MKTRTILAALVLFCAGLCLAYAGDANMGTWKLNEGKSTLGPGATKNLIVVYAPAGDMVKVIVDGVDKDAKPVHHEWTGKFDGKDYPVKGDAGHDTRAYTKVDDRTMELTNKKAGKTVTTGTIVLSADGKSRTVATKGSDPAMTFTAAYDKQ